MIGEKEKSINLLMQAIIENLSLSELSLFIDIRLTYLLSFLRQWSNAYKLDWMLNLLTGLQDWAAADNKFINEINIS